MLITVSRINNPWVSSLPLSASELTPSSGKQMQNVYQLHEQEGAADAEAAGPSKAEGGGQGGERRPRQQDRPKSHVADMLGAMAALQQQER